MRGGGSAKDIDRESAWRLVVPKASKSGVISNAYDPHTAGYMGVYKTFARVAERYYWPKMGADVAQYVKRCVTCAKHKPKTENYGDLLLSHRKPGVPWEVISNDFMGPLPNIWKSVHFGNYRLPEQVSLALRFKELDSWFFS